MNDSRFHCLQQIAERVTALQSDGYNIVVRHINDVSFFYKLRHRVNGNVITIAGDFIAEMMTQTRNGSITYEGTII